MGDPIQFSFMRVKTCPRAQAKYQNVKQHWGWQQTTGAAVAETIAPTPERYVVTAAGLLLQDGHVETPSHTDYGRRLRESK